MLDLGRQRVGSNLVSNLIMCPKSIKSVWKKCFILFQSTFVGKYSLYIMDLGVIQC